ncbi:3-dehydroquinate synthase [Butyrivibrio sp. NC3005]|uniref:3-dehydroquinate synthase n=1 Tax=Butyrivibrio sp. NC3005 TaxID=1280685 RepID=UPI0004258EBD|nr:3-dehydroquinate synthase [Butyrivibrio sp. NC3005]
MGEQILNVNYEEKPCYDIIFRNDFDGLASRVRELGFLKRKICIITDSNVRPLYLDCVRDLLKSVGKVFAFEIEAGEDNKNLNTVRNIYGYLIENHFDRHDLLVALGGGVVGDITGFAASTYLRGIAFIQIPTTLLAQTDSSIGGKTGVDFEGYKNMVGAFYMPALVYINTEVLKTLDDRQFAAGFAEVMKYGLIMDQEFYFWLIENMYEIQEKDNEVLTHMIYRSCECKKEVVEKDPKEQNERALLNFGHTIGHAIEKASNFKLLHGECVALGSIAAAYISMKKGLIETGTCYEIRDMFVPFNLPISVENIEPNQIAELIKSDKKVDNGTIRFILLHDIGKAFIDTTVTKEEICEAVKEILYMENGD